MENLFRPASKSVLSEKKIMVLLKLRNYGCLLLESFGVGLVKLCWTFRGFYFDENNSESASEAVKLWANRRKQEAKSNCILHNSETHEARKNVF